MLNKLELDKPRIVNLMIGTNKRVLDFMLNGQFSSLVWASDNYETVDHYYEGCIVKITVRLEPGRESEYCRGAEDLRDDDLSHYGYGRALMNCPAGATWWSFGSEYLRTHLVAIKEMSREEALEFSNKSN